MGKYLYCIIKESRPKEFKIPGLDEKKVNTVNYGDIAAVVSDAINKNGDYLITRDYMIAHQRVLEEVMRSGYDILPVSFGTVADSVDLIKEKLLKERRDEFNKTFAYINGKVELNLKVLWSDIASVFKGIASGNRVVRQAKQLSSHKPLNRFHAAGVGEAVKKALDAKRIEAAQKILSQVRPLAADIREGEILQDAMVCNETFLVPKSSGKEYDRRVVELARAYEGKMNFMSYGPLPPYNFVSIRVSFSD
jgi:hypothetical protein